MNPKIDVIKGLIKQGKGLVNPYDFEIKLVKPKFGFDIETSRRFSDLVQEFSFPSRTYSKQPVYYGGPLRNYPYIATYNGEINFTILMRKNDDIYEKLHAWHQYIISPDTNKVRFPSEYVCDQMQMSFQFKRKVGRAPTPPLLVGTTEIKESESGMVYTLTDVWPESLTDISMSNTAQNDYVRFGVVFSYRKWTTELPVKSGGGRFPGGNLPSNDIQ